MLAATMADAEKIKKATVKVLGCVEKVSSFASSIDPLFGVVSALVGLARTGLESSGEKVHELDGDFREIHGKLESISQRNRQALRQIRIDEVNETFGKYEEYIKHQYAALGAMVDRIKKDPEGTARHMTEFERVYERDKADMSLDIYYRGVMGTGSLFGRPLLRVYLEHCQGSRAVMEHRCSHLAHLFHIGLMALMAYTAVTEDDEEEVREKWERRVLDIQAKMEEALGQCDGDGASG